MDSAKVQEMILGQDGQGARVAADAPAWLQQLHVHRVEIVALLACVGLMLLVFELVRRHQIKEKYSFLWFITGLSLLVLTVRRDWLERLSAMIGVYYPPTALFLVLNFFVIVILVHYSIVLSKLLTQSQKLAQKVALLEAELVRHAANAQKEGQSEGEKR